jgi:hypothetical protein
VNEEHGIAGTFIDEGQPHTMRVETLQDAYPKAASTHPRSISEVAHITPLSSHMRNGYRPA